MKYNPYNYQLKGEEHVIDNLNCGLFLDMGLGKTVITLTALKKLMFEELEIGRPLVIAPKRVAELVWTGERDKWDHLGGLKISRILGTEKQRKCALAEDADVYIINRENIAWLVALYGGKSVPFDMLIIDELSSFKSAKSQRFKALRMVLGSFKRVVGLTGTPASNGLIDLWAQLYIIDRGERLGKSITKYRSTYFIPGRRNGDIIFNYSIIPGMDTVIKDKIADICISMKSEDYLDLPEVINNPIEVLLPEDVMQQYEDFEKSQILSFIESEQQITAASAAALSNKLLQFGNGAVYLEKDPDSKTHDYVEIHDEKLKALEEIMEDADGKPVLVAWAYRHDMYRMMKHFKKYGPRELKTEQDYKDWNAGLIPMLLVHPASAGHGLNMQDGGHIAVWFGLTWSLELYLQFNKRLHRPGQKHSVIFNILIAKGTEDERVLKVLQGKSTVQETLLEGLKAKIEKYRKLQGS